MIVYDERIELCEHLTFMVFLITKMECEGGKRSLKAQKIKCN